MQRQPRLVEVETVVLGRGEAGRVVAYGNEGEVAVIDQRLDVLLCERLKLLARIVSVAVDIEPLQREGGERLVEAPMMADCGDTSMVVEQHLGGDVHPFVRMRKRRGGRKREDDGEREFTKAQSLSPRSADRFSDAPLLRSVPGGCGADWSGYSAASARRSRPAAFISSCRADESQS